MALRQIVTAFGVVLMALSASALLMTIRDFVAALRLRGPSGAYNSSQVVFYGVFALTTLLISSALLRRHLRRRTPRVIFAMTTVIIVVVAIYAGYTGR
jgi:hypothetical protein